MKRTISLWLGLLAFALLPALAQTPAPTETTGNIHGHVTGVLNGAPVPAISGTVTLTTHGGPNAQYTFAISKTGDYAGQAPPGDYLLRVMFKDQSGYTEYSKTDIEVKIASGQDVQQDVDLGHPELYSASAYKGPTGKIHGRVIGPTGTLTTAGTVSLSLDGGMTPKFSFPLTADGNFAGEAAPGKYTMVYRAPDTPANKVVDEIEGVKVVTGQDVSQDMDMSRKEFLDKLTPDQRKQLEELKAKNAEAMKANDVIKSLNVDIKASAQDFRDADNARATATQALGATASRDDINAKEAEIKTAKYTDVETLMLKDTAAKPDASILWADLGQAQIGLKKYDQAEASYKKALDIEAASKKPLIDVQGLANAGLGEIYARTGKVAEANAAYDQAAKVNPERAGIYLKNEAVIFYQVNNPAAQAAAADEAIKADPNLAIAYYLKGNGLIPNSTIDPKTQKLLAPPGCLEAYQKYLELAPDGPYAAEVKDILTSFGQKVVTTYKAKSK
jgi:tetratricopeptide (TPR) repeat protein